MITKLLFPMSFIMLIIMSCESPDSYGPQVIETFGSEQAIVQEIRFKSNDFRIEGDLRLPNEGKMHPVVILVHGSGYATRYGAVEFEPLIEIFLRNRYAVFSWDKPGSGESTGEFEGGHTLTQRADILVDGIKAIAEHSNIDSKKVGLWGVSQAG